MPVPLFKTLYARPEAVFNASEGAAATSVGASGGGGGVIVDNNSTSNTSIPAGAPGFP